MKARTLAGIFFLVLALIGGLSSAAGARKVHYVSCKDCHKASATIRSVTNVCLDCHGSLSSYTLVDGSSVPINAQFADVDSSNVMNSAVLAGYNAASLTQTSHFWGASSDNQPTAGAQPPGTSLYYSRYGISTGKVTCTRCHNPHALDDNPKLLRVTDVGDAICFECHNSWNQSANQGVETHPMVASYYNAATANPSKLYNSVQNVGSGGVRLVGGGVSCTSCHSTHFADSNATTVDGPLNSATLGAGDGKLLRSDGPFREVTPYNETNSYVQAQLRSNICQACHTYKLHGKTSDGGPQIGCLDCHSGHSYNGGTPWAFVLRNRVTTYAPLYNAANWGSQNTVIFNTVVYNSAYAQITNEVWSNRVVGIGGYCEECHGDVQAAPIVGQSTTHQVGNTQSCIDCHKHDAAGWTYSFEPDASAATCGQCHGFPPHINVPGNRDDAGGTDGGYAYVKNDQPDAGWSYDDDVAGFKNEEQTAHQTHAGGKLAGNPGDWYFVGNAGLDNCRVCHGAGAGNTNHREQGVLASFRDVPFNDFSTYNSTLASAYDDAGGSPSWTCSAVYCHSNGDPRDGIIVTQTTPAWDQASGGGLNKIQGDVNRCNFCHGDSAANMTVKGNSARHNAHLGGGSMSITYECEACHVKTAVGSNALATTLYNATRGDLNGTHVNQVRDVNFASSGSALYNALGVNYNSVTYDAAAGTCSIYCHDPADAGNTADWDSAAAMQCDSCHGGTAADTSADGGVGPIATGSHTKHVTDASGPKLGCADCHGLNAGAGTHTGHIDGAFTVTAGVCDSCHGYDAGETQPVWGVTPTADEYCVTCHTGANRSTFGTYTAPASVTNAVAIGHNKASGKYGSGNTAAAKQCTSCHDTSVGGHFNAAADKLLIEGANPYGFPATYASNENAFCGACHGATPGNPAPSSKTGIVAHQGKLCIACHNPHGDGADAGNIYMILSASADYAGTVAFYNTTGLDSYDEDDGGDGTATENNADDLCATCHSAAANTLHNNRDNTGSHSGSDNLGVDCFTCHKSHTDAAPFGAGAGTACNDCHGYPPTTATGASSAAAGAHGNGTNLHSRIESYDKDIEDRTDCAYCHTGADQYTYDFDADQAAGGDRGNHALGLANRLSVMSTSVGYNSADGSCSNACHASSAADGFWTDTNVEGNSGNGLDCTACHYYNATPSSAGNGAHPAPVSNSHNDHFDKSKTCSECHNVENSGNSKPGGLTHINSFNFGTGPDGNDGAALQDMATASQNEAGAGANGVTHSGMTFIAGAADAGGPNNTCSGGIGLGCHASGSPDWDVAIPANGCVQCHTNTTDATVNPTSGLHGGPLTVTGNSHDDSFDGGPSGPSDCVTCHTTSPSSAHADGTLQNTAQTIALAAAVGFFDSGTPADPTDDTCANTCHSAGAAWSYRWSASAKNSNGTECANCHGDFTSGWNAGVGHSENPGRGNTTHTNTGNLTYPCTDCHSLGATNGAYPFTSGTNDWQAIELGTTLHGDGNINVNYNGTDWARSGSRSGCSACHEGATGTANGHDFPATTWNSVTLMGDPPDVSGACDGCHGGSGEYAPDNPSVLDAAYPDRAGKHAQHVSAIAIKLGGDTQANRNLTCKYCHLNPGEPGHDDNILPSANWDIRHILDYNSVDSNPVVNRASNQHVTCSTVDCHFNNAVTPHWYTDDIAPAAVTLSAQPGPNPRSIRVQWLAPGDDGNTANTTPYVYDMRFGTDSGTASNYNSTTNYVGELPAAYRQSYNSAVVVENLAAGTNYYFSLRTRDTAGNWSTTSNVIGPVQPTVDSQAPAFGGANKATPGDRSQTINLVWTPAEDHTMPITYKVWMVAEGAGSGPQGALDMDVDLPILTNVKAHEIQLTAADGVTNDTIYNLGVRACDALNKCDTNTQVVSATPTAEPKVPKNYYTYRTNGSTTLVQGGAAGTQVTDATLPVVFAPGSNNTYLVTYFVDTFAVYVNASNVGNAILRAELGTSTNGSDFTPSPVYKDVSVPKRGDRVYQFKIGDVVSGLTVPIGERFAIRISEPSTGTGALISYGSAATRGDVTLAEQNINSLPTGPAVSAGVTGADVNITWGSAYDDTVDGNADTVHYDLYGSDDNGATYRYLIATGLDAATTGYTWNTQEAGIFGAATVAVKLVAGDGYGHTTTTQTALAVDNSPDYVAPGAIDDLTAKPRPKSGSVWLTWTAPGDDNADNGRADHYDIRYSTSPITEGNWDSIPNTQWCTNVPAPRFGGEIQNYEVTGLFPGTNYYFAIKTYDDGGNPSPISTAKTAGSDQAVGGPRCGMCHTTAPSVVESVGNHKLHGFTLYDCDKCHTVDPGGPSEVKPSTYTLAHQDGTLKMGFGPLGAFQGHISGSRIYYTSDGFTDSGNNVIYDDTSGFGGFGDGTYNSVGDGIDNGSCFRWGALGVGGCHGPAGSDPDGAGPLPTYPTPNWTDAATLDCAACHGNPNRTKDSFYNRDFDGTINNSGVVPDQILGTPPVDNHGNIYNVSEPDEAKRKYIGQHEKHLNYSFRFSKSDSCNLCHSGKYRDRNDLDGKHANGEIDVQLDTVAAGPQAHYNSGTPTTAGTCFDMSPESCHPSTATPKWDSAQNFNCVQCHGMGGSTPTHTTDPFKFIDIDNDPDVTTYYNSTAEQMPGNCTYCHIGGHPQDDVGGTAVILANSSQVGINYRSKGIHLRNSIGDRNMDLDGNGTVTEAEVCWSCHQDNSVSEWGADDQGANSTTVPPNASDYNYGQIYSDAPGGTATPMWVTTGTTGAWWRSAVTNFQYKDGQIQSTHTTNELGSSAVTGTNYNKFETPDTIDKIRCSNCHDVHNLNKAPGDTMTGNPYLRGTWVRNPYPEDGAPWNKTYTAVNMFGVVPRGGTGNNQQGGYQIDQNNNSPTAGLSLGSSAGLCTLCHGTDVDNMDKTTGEDLWMTAGRNGHSNAAIGGTGNPSKTTNIFGHGIGGRPTPSIADVSTNRGSNDFNDVFDMAVQYININGTPGQTRGYAYRSRRVANLLPKIDTDFAYQDFNWGVTVDATTIDVGYHAFTCSKCHNPHASRLPKLMITNCLDTSHNTWDDVQGDIQDMWTAGGNSTVYDVNETTSTHNTAQNCHRYDRGDNVGGWNMVTPWQ